MRILVVGDVVGKPGRRAVQTLVPSLRRDEGIDLVIANGENAAGGFGLTADTAYELLESGVDVLTSGNHIWDQKEIIPYLDEGPAAGAPGQLPRRSGARQLGARQRFGSQPDGPGCSCRPWTALSAPPTKYCGKRGASSAPPVIIVDFHAEATSEKQAMGWYLDGRVSAVLGTHTHVGTVDTRVLPKGTAFVSDVGMTGPMDSVIGSEVSAVVDRFLTGMPQRLPVAGGPVVMNSVLIDVDRETGKSLAIERVDRIVS